MKKSKQGEPAKKNHGKILTKILNFIEEVSSEHIGAYSAQAAFFFMFSLIPILLLLLTLVQYTSVPKDEVIKAVIEVFPSSVQTFITSIVNQVYRKSLHIIPITIVVALWSAGKGVMAISTGLNNIFHCKETRNYFFIRIRATLYTVAYVIAMVLVLVLSVFGRSLREFLDEKIPILKNVTRQVMEIQFFVTAIVLFLLFLMVYKFLPNRKILLKTQLPGALFATAGWLIVSWIFSVYVDIFKGFSDMYGSLTTIILIMLWLYFGMYCVLLGGKVSASFHKWYIERKNT
jgi:membrane protein